MTQIEQLKESEDEQIRNQNFDNSLRTGVYPIAEGYTYHVANRTVIVTKKVRSIQPGDYRCKDCKKQIIGKCIRGPWISKVCSAKPKRMYGNTQLYYCAPDTRKSCELFELKDEFKNEL